MRRLWRLMAAVLMLTMLGCGALTEEEIVSEAFEAQVDEIELALGEAAFEPGEALIPGGEANAPEMDLNLIGEVPEPAQASVRAEARLPRMDEAGQPEYPRTIKLGLGEKRRLPGFDAEGPVAVTSSKRKVVSVSADGVLKGKKRGSAVITVKMPDGQSHAVTVKVLDAPTQLKLSPKKLAMEVGDAALLKAKVKKKQAGAVSFSSSDPSVIQVDELGRVNAIAPGSGEIVARSYNGKKAKCRVKVVAPAARIDLPEKIHVAIDERAEIPYSVTDANGAAYDGPISANLSPKSIAAYKKGRIIGKRAGEARFTVEAGRLSRSCRVVVDAYGSVHPAQSIAHRGSAHWPENSLEAFRNFASTGADGVELDARSTLDGVQVIFHDPGFPVDDGTFVIKEHTFSELRALRPSVCTLDEALDVLKATGKSIHLEFKETADGAKCVQAVKAHGLQSRTVYFSFFSAPLKQAYGANPSASYGLSLKSSAKPTSKSLLDRAKRLHISFFVAHKKLMRRKVVDYWHSLGYKISVWTVNDMPTVEKLLDMGVDYILSDYPEYCVQAKSRR